MSAPAACALVFDLDHTLVSSPLDLRAMARDLEAFVRGQGVRLPARQARWAAPALEGEFWQIALTHEEQALLRAELGPGALEALRAVRALGFRTALWTNNGGGVTRQVLERFALAPHLDLVVTRDEVRHLKPDPDGLRVVLERWQDLGATYVVGDSWVDGLAARDGGVPFIAYCADHEELGRRGVPIWAATAHLGELRALFA